MNEPDTQLLSEIEVAEIATKKPFQYGTMVSLTVGQREQLEAAVSPVNNQEVK